MATYEKINLLNALIPGRYPVWKEQTTGSSYSGDPSFTGAPATGGAGCSLADGQGQSYSSIVSRLAVQLREDVSRRTVRVHEGTYSIGDTYTITVSGNAVAVVGGATWAACVAQLVAALPGVPAADALVSFTAVVGTFGTYLLIQGRAEADYSIGITTAAAGIMKAYADPTSASVRIFSYPRNATTESTVTYGPSGWLLFADIGAIDYRGYYDAVQTAAWDRGYVECYSVTGVAGDAAAGANTLAYLDNPSTTGTRTGLRVFWGPCYDEV